MDASWPTSCCSNGSLQLIMLLVGYLHRTEVEPVLTIWSMRHARPLNRANPPEIPNRRCPVIIFHPPPRLSFFSIVHPIHGGFSQRDHLVIGLVYTTCELILFYRLLSPGVSVAALASRNHRAAALHQRGPISVDTLGQFAPLGFPP
jgi:hypothetical protein